MDTHRLGEWKSWTPMDWRKSWTPIDWGSGNHGYP
jgi:hypothetical protein